MGVCIVSYADITNGSHHPRTTIVKIFVSMHESYVKMGVFVLRFQGHQAYNRFMEGKKGFQGSKAQFLV